MTDILMLFFKQYCSLSRYWRTIYESWRHVMK